MPNIISVCHTPIELFNGSMGLYKLEGLGAVGAETCASASARSRTP